MDLRQIRDKKQYPAAWIQMYPSGMPFWPLSPNHELIFPGDIAWHLSMTCRYNGGVRRFYSVAEHSLYIYREASERSKPWALLHDAHEAYIGDIVRPIKFIFGDQLREITDRIDQAIAQRFGLTWPIPDDIETEIKTLDHRILADECDALHTSPPFSWDAGNPLGIRKMKWAPMSSTTSYARFRDAMVDMGME